MCDSTLEVTALHTSRTFSCYRPAGHDGWHQALALAPDYERARSIDAVELPENPTGSVDLGAGHRATPTDDVVVTWRPVALPAPAAEAPAADAGE